MFFFANTVVHHNIFAYPVAHYIFRESSLTQGLPGPPLSAFPFSEARVASAPKNVNPVVRHDLFADPVAHHIFSANPVEHHSFISTCIRESS